MDWHAIKINQWKCEQQNNNNLLMWIKKGFD